MEKNQTLQRGVQGYITCNAFPGDPPQRMFWTHGGNVLRSSGRITVRSQSLLIDNVEFSDEGIYTCRFTEHGNHEFSINVNVIEIPELEIDIPPSHPINFTTDLEIECKTTPSHAETYWLVPRHNGAQTRIDGSRLFIEGGREDLSGIYTCVASLPDRRIRNQRSVEVIQTDIPVRFPQPKELPINTVEGDTHLLHKDLLFSLESSDLTFQWTRKMEAVDFGPRFSYTIERTHLTMKISHAEVSDRGTYQLTVSNQHGMDTLAVTMYVTEQIKTTLELEFEDVACEKLEVRFSITFYLHD